MPLNVMKMTPKSLPLNMECMFARSMVNGADMNERSRFLNRASDLVDHGYILASIGKNLGTVNADHLRAANAELSSGWSIDKIVCKGL